jgi:hypothetical protein
MGAKIANREEIEKMLADAEGQIEMKRAVARQGHCHALAQHVRDSFRMLELASLARIGFRLVEIAASERGGAVHADQVEAGLARARQARGGAGRTTGRDGPA